MNILIVGHEMIEDKGCQALILTQIRMLTNTLPESQFKIVPWTFDMTLPVSTSRISYVNSFAANSTQTHFHLATSLSDSWFKSPVLPEVSDGELAEGSFK